MEGIPQVEMDWVSHVLHVKNCQQNNEPRNISPWSLKSYELRHEAALSPHGLTRAELKRLTADRPVDSLSHVKHEVLTKFFQPKLHSQFGDWPTWASDWIWTPIFCEGSNCVTTTPPSKQHHPADHPVLGWVIEKALLYRFSQNPSLSSVKGAGGGPDMTDHQNRFYGVFWKRKTRSTSCFLPHQKMLIVAKVIAGQRSAPVCISIVRAIFKRDLPHITIF